LGDVPEKERNVAIGMIQKTVTPKSTREQPASSSVHNQNAFLYREATIHDLDQLVELEKSCFSMDVLSRRNFLWMIKRANSVLQVVEQTGKIVAYILLLFHQGTVLARIYSIAVHPSLQGGGVGKKLLQHAEQIAIDHKCLFIRLEVRPDNINAIEFYKKAHYASFGVIEDFYEDHSFAIRMEKRLRGLAPEALQRHIPYYRQTTDFTCGPACLMMAMKTLDAAYVLSRHLELQIWREATTIFMTSGHGGCSPQGLALSAYRRQFSVDLHVSHKGVFLLEGVRSEEKKSVMRLVHEDFVQQIQQETDIQLIVHHFTLENIRQAIEDGGIPCCLISAYHFNRTKTPHWVVVSHIESGYVYLHDPEVDEDQDKTSTDCVYLPVHQRIFERITCFGKQKERAMVIIYPWRSLSASSS